MEPAIRGDRTSCAVTVEKKLIKLAEGLLAAAVLTGCGTPQAPVTPSAVKVAAAENFWGNIAAQVGGRHARVTSILSSPAADPHLHERALAVAVAGAALYLVLPSLIAVLGAWPRLSTLSPGWFAVVTAGLAGNTVTDSLPGGDAAVQFRMLTTAGFDTDTAVGGLTAFSLLGVGERAADPGRHACRRRRPGHPCLPDRLLLAPAAGRAAGLLAVPPPLRTTGPPARHAGRGRPAISGQLSARWALPGLWPANTARRATRLSGRT